MSVLIQLSDIQSALPIIRENVFFLLISASVGMNTLNDSANDKKQEEVGIVVLHYFSAFCS